jgi:hypothetical protein
MRLSELYEGLYYRGNSSGQTACLSVAKGGIPSMVFFSNTGVLNNSDNITVAIVATTKVKKFTSSIYSPYIEKSEKEKMIEVRASLWNSPIKPDAKEIFKKYPEFFKLIDL